MSDLVDQIRRLAARVDRHRFYFRIGRASMVEIMREFDRTEEPKRMFTAIDGVEIKLVAGKGFEVVEYSEKEQAEIRAARLRASVLDTPMGGPALPVCVPRGGYRH